MPAHRARRAGRDDGPPQWPTLERGAPSTRFFTLLFVENPRYRLRHDSSATPQARHVRQGLRLRRWIPPPAGVRFVEGQECMKLPAGGAIGRQQTKPAREQTSAVSSTSVAIRECLPARAPCCWLRRSPVRAAAAR